MHTAYKILILISMQYNKTGIKIYKTYKLLAISFESLSERSH